MNIMLQNHTFHPVLGGIENYLSHVSKILKEMGHQPIILCENTNAEVMDIEMYNGIKIIRHPYYNVPKLLLSVKPKIVTQQLKHFISKHVANVDLIVSRYPHYCFATTELDLDIPIFYIPPSVFWKQLNKASVNQSMKIKFFNFIWKRSLDDMERKSILQSRKTFVFSQNNAESLTRYYRLGIFEFPVIPPGVQINRFTRSKDWGLVKELNIGDETIVLLYVGRLPPEKNVGRLLKEVQKLRKDNVKLLIVGDGSERRRLEKMCGALGLEEKVFFLGIREDVERFYSIADIFISPSKYEPFGQVILEAMAAGLPCIAFKRVWPEYEVASEEIIRDRVTGFCVDPYNKQELQERLLYLIENPDIRIRMGKAGREECRRKFTWEHHVKRLLDPATS